MSRRRFGPAAAVLLLSLVAACTSAESDVVTEEKPAAVATGAPNTVRVDLARSLGRFPFKLGSQLSAVPKSWRYGRNTLANLDRLDLIRVRVWLKFTDAYDVASRTPQYERAYDYLDTYHSRSDILIVNWQTNRDPLVTKGAFTRDELVAAERDMLAHYKKRYPKLQFVEAENEPADIDAYYEDYRLLYQVVNAVDAMTLPGPALQVGGPTLDTFSERRIGRFLDLYKADTDHGKRLDFVSYHQYLITAEGDWHAHKDSPALVGTERARLDAMLAARGLSSRPALVSETGTFPAERESSPPLGLTADWHIQAAALASMHFHYANQRDIVPLHWTVDHPENDRKDMFVDTESGEPLPYYNAMLMQSMLPDVRYQATSDTLSTDGIGVYGLAAAAAGTVAVMTWNYQWTRDGSYLSTVRIANLPKEFRTSNVLVERYKIGDEMHTGGLRRVESFVSRPRAHGGFEAPVVPLRPNELHLLVLTPTKDAAGPRP